MSAHPKPGPQILPLSPPSKELTQRSLTTRRSILATSPVKPPAPVVELELAILDEEGARYVHPLGQGPVTVGRRLENDVVLSNPQISGFHAEIRRLDTGEYEVLDCRSFNGTVVNGERINRATIKAGDVVCFGRIEARVIASASNLPLTQPQSNPDMADHNQAIEELQQECQRLRADRDRLREERDSHTSVIDQLNRQRCRAEELATEVSFQLKQEQAELDRVRADVEKERAHLEVALAKLTKTRQEATLAQKHLQALREQLGANQSAMASGETTVSAPAFTIQPFQIAKVAQAAEGVAASTKPTPPAAPSVKAEEPKAKSELEQIRDQLAAMRQERERLTRSHEPLEKAPEAEEKPPEEKGESNIICLAKATGQTKIPPPDCVAKKAPESEKPEADDLTEANDSKSSD